MHGLEAGLIGKGIHVCVVEDDDDLREELVGTLGDMGFTVRGFGDAQGLYLGLLQSPCDVVILDLGLPGEDGFSIMQHIKGLRVMGIVILTASSSTDEMVRCLSDGADAFVTKPFEFRALAASLVSVHRRVSGAAAPVAATPAQDSPAQAAQVAPVDWHLADGGWTLRTPCGRRVGLTSSERIVLQSLFDRPNHTVKREILVTALGYDSEFYLDHRLGMLVTRLRRKVRDSVGLELPLKSVRGVGFMLIMGGQG